MYYYSPRTAYVVSMTVWIDARVSPNGGWLASNRCGDDTPAQRRQYPTHPRHSVATGSLPSCQPRHFSAVSRTSRRSCRQREKRTTGEVHAMGCDGGLRTVDSASTRTTNQTRCCLKPRLRKPGGSSGGGNKDSLNSVYHYRPHKCGRWLLQASSAGMFG